MDKIFLAFGELPPPYDGPAADCWHHEVKILMRSSQDLMRRLEDFGTVLQSPKCMSKSGKFIVAFGLLRLFLRR